MLSEPPLTSYVSNMLQSLASWRRASTALNMVTKPFQLEADASFEDVVLKSELPVLVDFHARYVKHTVVVKYTAVSLVDGLGSSFLLSPVDGSASFGWGANLLGGVDHMQNHIEIKIPTNICSFCFSVDTVRHFTAAR